MGVRSIGRICFRVFFWVASVWVAPIASVASQLGGPAECWLNRRANAKDSSPLIPSHCGVLDRFDGLVAASVATLVLQSLGLLQPVSGWIPPTSK